MAAPVGHMDVTWSPALPAMSREYEDLGFPSCSLPLGRKTYLLAQGGLWDLEFQCLDFLSLPSHQLNLVLKKKKKGKEKKYNNIFSKKKKKFSILIWFHKVF